MKKILLILGVVLITTSCFREVFPCFPLPISSDAKLLENEPYGCIMPDIPGETNKNGLKNSGGKIGNNSFFNKNVKWKNGETIRVKFLSGDPCIQEAVKKYASEWLRYANIRFEFVESNQIADIKISIDTNITKFTGSSQLGTDCRYIKQDQPSMRLSLNKFKPEFLYRQLILHEFGHALGLKHEHQHPNSTINWNVQSVYAYYLGVLGRTKEDVDKQVLYKFEPSDPSIDYFEYDQKSIMHYNILPFLTTDLKGVPLNTNLSKNDKKNIAKMYPKNIVSF